MEHLKLLHVGCASKYMEGFINSDMRDEWKGKKHKLDEIFNIGGRWPHEDESVDGIVGMAIFQQLHWRDLVVALEEAHRVLKKGGVLRMGVPLSESDKPLEHLLGWNNINLFSYDLLERVLIKKIGFSQCSLRNVGQSALPMLAKADNRADHQFNIEAIK